MTWDISHDVTGLVLFDIITWENIYEHYYFKIMSDFLEILIKNIEDHKHMHLESDCCTSKKNHKKWKKLIKKIA